MTISTSMQYQQALLYIETNYAQLSQYQYQLSSGTTIQVASDNPLGMAQVMQNNVQSSSLATDLSSLNSANSDLQTGVSALTQIQNIITNVQALAQQANNTTTLPTTNQTLATQVNADITQLVQIANQQLPDGQYLFGGTNSSVQPFTVTSTNNSGQPAVVSYQGNDQSSNDIVSQGVSVQTLIPGDQVFDAQDRSATVFTGTTGAAAGTGTDSGTGQGTLLVQHVLTTVGGNSGVTIGTSSASGDTIIGQSGANSIQIVSTGSGGSVSLNGGTPVSFSSNDTNLRVSGPNGEIVFLDMSDLLPGFKGSVPLTATGTISTDSGKTAVPIDFSSNQVVTNGATGAVTNVDTSKIRIAGADRINYTGTSGLFQTLISLRDTIANTSSLSASDRSTLLGQQLGELTRIGTHVTNAMGMQSAQAQSLSQLQTTLTDRQTSLAAQTGSIQDTNVAATVVKLQQAMNVYQASLQVAAQINQLSLANFLKI